MQGGLHGVLYLKLRALRIVQPFRSGLSPAVGISQPVLVFQMLDNLLAALPFELIRDDSAVIIDTVIH